MNWLIDLIIKLLDSWFRKPVVELPEKPKPVDLEFRNYRLLETANAEIGVKEVAGKGNNAKVVKYHKYSTLSNKKGANDSVPWCSSFMCYVCETTLVKGRRVGSTNSKAARSWLDWGRSSKSNPLPGDIVVYWRGSKAGWQGHVGFYLGEKNDHIYTLGGNQRDMVNVSTYSRIKLLDIRRSSKHIRLDEVQEDALWDLAERILRSNGIRG